MQLDWIAHLVLLGDRADVPLPDLEVFASGQPSLVLRHEPDLGLHYFTSFNLEEKL